MHSRVARVVIIAAVLVFALGVVGPAVAGGANDDVIEDASNGTVDQDWSAAQIRAALAYLRQNTTATQYSDVEGVLEDYLAGLGGSSEASGPGAMAAGELAFTGGEVWLILLTGAGLVGGGLVLKRRVRA